MFVLFKKSKYHNLTEIPRRREFVVNYKTKYPLFLYRILHKKMIECIEAIYGGYPEDKYIFYPPHDGLYDLYVDIRRRFLEIDNSAEFMVLPVTRLNTFILEINYKDSSRMWEHLKKDIYEEHEMLVKNTQPGYEIPDDLQLAFYRIDKFVKRHTEEKNIVLRENHIYPANNYDIFTWNDSYIKDIYRILSEANGEYVLLKEIAKKIGIKKLEYVRVMIGELKKTIKKHTNNITIVASRKSSYRLIIS